MQKKDIEPGALLGHRSSKVYGDISAALATGPHWVRWVGPSRRFGRSGIPGEPKGYRLTEDGSEAEGVLVLVPSHADVASALTHWAATGATPQASPVPHEAVKAVSRMQERLRDGELIEVHSKDLEPAAPEGWTWTVYRTATLSASYVEGATAEAQSKARKRQREGELNVREESNRQRRDSVNGGLAALGIESLVHPVDFGGLRDSEDPKMGIRLSDLETVLARLFAVKNAATIALEELDQGHLAAARDALVPALKNEE